jgi:small subunit ribosomal protein S25e
MAKKQDKGKDAKGDKGKTTKAGAVPGKKSGGAKAKKKSWTKVKVKEKLNNAVFLDQKAYERIVKDAPKFLTITVSELVNKFKVNGSVARKIIRDLSTKGLIRQVGDHNAAFSIYSGKEAKLPEKKQ